MNKKSFLGIFTVILIAVVGTAAYFGWNDLQTHRGEQALTETGLKFDSLQEALVSAKANDKPVLVDFSALWCPVCRTLHAHVFTDQDVKRVIESGYVLARVDFDSAEAQVFMQKYDVSGFPSLLVLDADGRLLRHLAVTLDPQTFVTELSVGQN